MGAFLALVSLIMARGCLMGRSGLEDRLALRLRKNSLTSRVLGI